MAVQLFRKQKKETGEKRLGRKNERRKEHG
jgi:hypothetical protein